MRGFVNCGFLTPYVHFPNGRTWQWYGSGLKEVSPMRLLGRAYRLQFSVHHRRVERSRKGK